MGNFPANHAGLAEGDHVSGAVWDGFNTTFIQKKMEEAGGETGDGYTRTLHQPF